MVFLGNFINGFCEISQRGSGGGARGGSGGIDLVVDGSVGGGYGGEGNGGAVLESYLDLL